MHRMLALALVATAACGGDPDPIDPPADALTDAEIAQIHGAVDRSLGHGLASGYSIAVWRDGAVIYAEGFGDRDDAGTPTSADTLFQIGSDTKKITAIALLRQVDAGAIALDDTVSSIVPDLA